ncbi:TNFSF12 [Branchiostoma lanceolatum]|uniref:TNFSF12 protein n=1 Tax=Branchiostoma lanceolatum TaxID=7740 RepID=A0A8K0EA15_BRALA|nr:TNFSF12 [Branchiostoma lanceolatum]
MSPPSPHSGNDTNSSSCDCRKPLLPPRGRLSAVVSCVVLMCVLVCLRFSGWTYVRIVELQTELSKCRCVGQKEKWREGQVFSEGRDRRKDQSSLGAVPADLVYPAEEDDENIYHDNSFDSIGYQSSNSSVNQKTFRRLRRDERRITGDQRELENIGQEDKNKKGKRRRCRRKGRRQKAQSHVHYEAAEYSVVSVAGTVSFWQLSDWFAPEGCWFVLKNGHVRVKEAGVYWIYAQVTFEDRKDAVLAQVLLGGRGDRPPTPVLTCAGNQQDAAVPTGRRARTCFVAGIRRLDRNDRITVEAWGGVKASPDYTYFGLLKLGI